MTPETLLLRQIHPSFCQQGRATSQAFRPTPKDQSQLSVDNGDQISPEASWQRYQSQGFSSLGIMAISHIECSDQSLPVVQDGHPHPEHCYIDFASFNPKAAERAGKVLREYAAQRGWLAGG
jgi:hypothetical protein